MNSKYAVDLRELRGKTRRSHGFGREHSIDLSMERFDTARLCSVGRVFRKRSTVGTGQSVRCGIRKIWNGHSITSVERNSSVFAMTFSIPVPPSSITLWKPVSVHLNVFMLSTLRLQSTNTDSQSVALNLKLNLHLIDPQTYLDMRHVENSRCRLFIMWQKSYTYTSKYIIASFRH